MTDNTSKICSQQPPKKQSQAIFDFMSKHETICIAFVTWIIGIVVYSLKLATQYQQQIFSLAHANASPALPHTLGIAPYLLFIAAFPILLLLWEACVRIFKTSDHSNKTAVIFFSGAVMWIIASACILSVIAYPKQNLSCCKIFITTFFILLLLFILYITHDPSQPFFSDIHIVASIVLYLCIIAIACVYFTSQDLPCESAFNLTVQRTDLDSNWFLAREEYRAYRYPRKKALGMIRGRNERPKAPELEQAAK